MLDFIFLFIILLVVLLGFARGFVREIFGLAGLVLTMLITINSWDVFLLIFKVKPGPIVNFVSSGAVFIICFVMIAIANSWLMYMLKPIRLGIIDRFFGAICGIFKGIFFCYLIFACLNTFYYSIIYQPEDAKKQQQKDYYLPVWIKSCQSYPFLMYFDTVANKVLPSTVNEDIKSLGQTTMEKLRTEEAKSRKAKQDEEK